MIPMTDEPNLLLILTGVMKRYTLGVVKSFCFSLDYCLFNCSRAQGGPL